MYLAGLGFKYCVLKGEQQTAFYALQVVNRLREGSKRGLHRYVVKVLRWWARDVAAALLCGLVGGVVPLVVVDVLGVVGVDMAGSGVAVSHASLP